ncbi:hypothetical protein [Xenorhabdus bovienii]|uniref:hypothetical protein n=1 Tax=Xenorhabdus bovienii TaxID=40576 RepID=UPI002156F858|nr:hypothetical protein [Xenorhabdus bovienii]
MNNVKTASNVKFLSSPSNFQGEVRVLSAPYLYVVCDAFLELTTTHLDDRWIRKIEPREQLARQLTKNVSDEWIHYTEWKRLIQDVLNSAHQRYLCSPISEWADCENWNAVETDIHIAVQCTRRTVLYYDYNQLGDLPARATGFLVPARLNDFFASLLAGTLTPVWATTVDAELTPDCLFDVYPRCKQKEI